MTDNLKNVTIIKSGNHEIGLECVFDKVIVLMDKFKTGFECTKCEGECYLNEPCDFCKTSPGLEGKGTENERPCRMCCPPNLMQSGGQKPGYKVCPQCKGKGGTIIAPETSKMKVSSGVVTSCGPDVKNFKVGDRVLHGFWAGTEISMKQKSVLRIMGEQEIMCKIYGTQKFDEFME